jgi:hypothetical protein
LRMQLRLQVWSNTVECISGRVIYGARRLASHPLAINPFFDLNQARLWQQGVTLSQNSTRLKV